MTTYIPGILYTRANGQWMQTDKIRFATEAEAAAYLAELQSRRDDILETRISTSDFRPTRIWNFEHNIMVNRDRMHSGDLRRKPWRERIKSS